MGADASWPLRRGIFAKLETDRAVGAWCAAYRGDGSGEAGRRPGDLVSLERWHARAWHSATFDGQEHEIRLAAELACDEAEAAALGAAIVACLHDADIAIPGHALIELSFESNEIRYDAERARCRCRWCFRALTVSD
ncbi:MAG: DUF3168 domain-containing protein [Rhodothalassiaceae bacterium]